MNTMENPQNFLMFFKKDGGEHMHKDDMYSKEACLRNLAQRELANGVDKDSIYKLRLQCLSRGATGILGLARAFRVMDDDGSETLSLKEFRKGIVDAGLNATEEEIHDMFNRFDTDGNGRISMSEFLVNLRPPINKTRLGVLDRAFAKLDKNQDGDITIEDLKNVYCVKDHPKYLSGELSEEEILTTFLNNFEHGSPQRNGVVTKEEFINYYATISASIDNDGYFDLVLRRAYKL